MNKKIDTLNPVCDAVARTFVKANALISTCCMETFKSIDVSPAGLQIVVAMIAGKIRERLLQELDMNFASLGYPLDVRLETVCEKIKCNEINETEALATCTYLLLKKLLETSEKTIIAKSCDYIDGIQTHKKFSKEKACRGLVTLIKKDITELTEYTRNQLRQEFSVQPV